jgi:cytohesin
MSLLLPPNPNLRHLKGQVDDLIASFAERNVDALRVVREHLPRVAGDATLTRAHAMFVLARQYGFESWPQLKAFVEGDAEREEAEALCDAAKRNDLGGLRRLLDDDPSVINSMVDWGMTPLYCAARWGQPQTVALLLERGADPNVRNGEAMFDCRNVESLRLMLEHGGDATMLHDDHRAHRASLLHQAAFRGDVKMLEVVLAHGGAQHLDSRLAQGNEGRHAGLTPLQAAARAGQRAFAHAIIARGARYDSFSAAALGDVEPLRAAGKLDALDAYGATLLHWAVEANQAAVVAMLLAAGADIDAADAFGETPLLLATTHDADRIDRRALAPLLVSRGARVDALAAAAMGDVEQVRSLPSVTSVHGWTPLHWAARNGHLDVVEFLIGSAGADVNAADAIGWTPLFPAAYWGRRTEVVRILLAAGADANRRDKFGRVIQDYDVGPEVFAVLSRQR